jgi:hypothetical protein
MWSVEWRPGAPGGKSFRLAAYCEDECVLVAQVCGVLRLVAIGGSDASVGAKARSRLH